MTTADTRTRKQTILDQRLWIALILRISQQAAHELLRHAYDDELIAIDDTQAEPPRVKRQLVKTIAAAIYERTDTGRQANE